MSLVLTTADARRLTTTLQVLSAPLDAATPEQWVRTVQKQLRELFSADHALFVATGQSGPTVLAEGYRAEVSEEAAAVLTAPDPINVAHSTARHHAERILAKLGLTSRSGLVLRLLQAS